MSVPQWIGLSSFVIKQIDKALSHLNQVFSDENITFNTIDEVFEYCGLNLHSNTDKTFSIEVIGNRVYQEKKLVTALSQLVEEKGVIEIYMEDGLGPGNFLSK